MLPYLRKENSLARFHNHFIAPSLRSTRVWVKPREWSHLNLSRTEVSIKSFKKYIENSIYQFVPNYDPYEGHKRLIFLAWIVDKILLIWIKFDIVFLWVAWAVLLSEWRPPAVRQPPPNRNCSEETWRKVHDHHGVSESSKAIQVMWK